MKNVGASILPGEGDIQLQRLSFIDWRSWPSASWKNGARLREHHQLTRPMRSLDLAGWLEYGFYYVTRLLQ
jgi:hypothetical protein